jgi:hypothetical protein
MSYGGLPNARALLGTHATWYRTFGPERVEGLGPYVAWCTEQDLDPADGPDDADEATVASLAAGLAELRKQAREAARTPSERVFAGLFDATGYRDPTELDDATRATVEYVRADGLGVPRWRPSELPRLRVLELHDNDLDAVSLLDFDFEELGQLELVTLHGNRLKELPPLPPSVKLATLVSDAPVAPLVAASPPGSPAAVTASTGQILLLAGGLQLFAAALMSVVALAALINTFGLCCPALLLPIPPFVMALNDLRIGFGLSSGAPRRGTANDATLLMMFAVGYAVMANIVLVFAPVLLVPVVLEIVASARLGRKDVQKYHLGESD